MRIRAEEGDVFRRCAARRKFCVDRLRSYGVQLAGILIYPKPWSVSFPSENFNDFLAWLLYAFL